MSSSYFKQIFGKMSLINISYFAVISLIVACSLVVDPTEAVQQDSVKASSANLTAHNTPYAYYDYERDPRRWFAGHPWAAGGPAGAGATYGGGPLAQFPGGLEAIAIGLMMAVGAGFIVIPLMIILYMIFIAPTTGNPNLNGGFNFIQHPATTTIAGRRRRREASESGPSIAGLPLDLISSVNHEKVLSFFKKFTDASDRMEYLKNLLKQ